jgi:replication-associated recombination protein RarA
MPSKLKDRKYYFPTDRGFEREIKRRIKYWEKIKENLKKIKKD